MTRRFSMVGGGGGVMKGSRNGEVLLWSYRGKLSGWGKADAAHSLLMATSNWRQKCTYCASHDFKSVFGMCSMEKGFIFSKMHYTDSQYTAATLTDVEWHHKSQLFNSYSPKLCIDIFPCVISSCTLGCYSGHQPSLSPKLISIPSSAHFSSHSWKRLQSVAKQLGHLTVFFRIFEYPNTNVGQTQNEVLQRVFNID